MIPNPIPSTPPGPVMHYTIRVRGRLDAKDWANWFGGMTLKVDEDHSETCLIGLVADQAELYGLLTRLRNLGLTLLSVEGNSPK